MRTDSFSDLDSLARGLLSQRAGSSRSPQFMPIDVYRVDDQYLIHADLPGMDPGSIDVSADRGTLTLTAHRTAPPEDDVQWLTSERFSGVYRRQLSLGQNVDLERVSARYDNGVLTITVPLHERARPRQIAVEHGASTREVVAAQPSRSDAS